MVDAVLGMGFRARLLELAGEHDALLMEYHCLFKENQQLRWRLSTAKPADQRLGPAAAHLRIPIREEATRPSPSAPSFDADACDDRNATDVSLFQLLSQDDEHQTNALMDVQALRSKEVGGALSPIEEEEGACDSGPEWHSSTSRKGSNGRCAESGRSSKGDLSSVGNAKRTTMIRAGRSTSTALRAVAMARRMRSLVRLGLLDDDSVDPTSPGSTNSQETHEEDADLDDRIQSFWNTYSDLDRHGKGISAEVLHNFDKELPGTNRDSDRLNRFRSTIEDFNAYAIRVMGDDCDCSDRSHLSFRVFVELMLLEGLEFELGDDLADNVTEIRNMFIFEQATKLVAGVSRVSNEDIYSSGMDMTLMYTDSVVCLIIMLNALVAAISTDHHQNWIGWLVFECIFLSFFIGEAIVKTRITGLKEHVCGHDCFWNWFDCFIILAALVDVAVFLCFGLEMGNITTFRLLRLLKVARVVKILRLKAFKELTLMVQGVLAGMRTLGWASALLVFCLFCLGMVLRQTIGTEKPECTGETEVSSDCSHIDIYRVDLFSSVGRSMFTVLRCFTTGCESRDGTPLTLHLWEEYGWPIIFAYVVCFLFVTFGLSNLIMAIFVENTMEAAKFNEQKRQHMRSHENIRTAKLLHKLMLRFCTAQAHTKKAERTRPFNLQVTHDLFRKVIGEPETENILDDLGIQVANPHDIFEVLDSDDSGCVDLHELITGFMKMRGHADKGDAVATLLKLDTLLKLLRKFESRAMPLLGAASSKACLLRADSDVVRKKLPEN